MTGVEYENRSFWEKKWTTEENIERRTQQEESRTVGVDGEDYFDRKVLKEARGKEVLDIGCGRGEFTLSVAAVAKKVVGVDFSKTAISQAIVNTSLQGVTNVELKLADASSIPHPGESFGLACGRRGPATYSKKRLGRKTSLTGNKSSEEAKTSHSKNPCRLKRGSCSLEPALEKRQSKNSKPLNSTGPSKT